jgi:hypothetical protein
MSATDTKRIAGLTSPQKTALHRVPLRTRGAGYTASAWRLEVLSAEGQSSITLAEGPSGSFYRGDGALLGASQEGMAALWTELTTPTVADDENAISPQLG